MRIPKGGIAFFDSGIGGLTVLSACEKRLQSGLFYYYGDNQHAPYGNLPVKKIRRYVFKAFRKFSRLRVSAAVIACNTATAVCVEELRAKYSFPIIGAEPAVYTAAAKGGRVLILATRATCESDRLAKLCQRASERFPNAKIRTYACERLAEEIERNADRAGYDFTSHLPKLEADAVVLGCTHYIYIVEQIARHFGCPIYDGNDGIARQLARVLKKQNNLTPNWDWRPFEVHFDHKLGRLTPKKNKFALCQKITNKRSQKMGKNAMKYSKAPIVFFLGKQREYNEKTRKQMFAWL